MLITGATLRRLDLTASPLNNERATWQLACKRILNSGGLHQFYYNSTGNLAAEAPTILSRIRADRLAQVLTKANALFGDGGPSQDRAKRIDQLDALSAEAKQALEQLTANYYELEEKSGTVGDWLEKHLLAQRSSDK
jgi:hypothetical protein